jgi:hypothetical protein
MHIIIRFQTMNVSSIPFPEHLQDILLFLLERRGAVVILSWFSLLPLLSLAIE